MASGAPDEGSARGMQVGKGTNLRGERGLHTFLGCPVPGEDSFCARIVENKASRAQVCLSMVFIVRREDEVFCVLSYGVPVDFASILLAVLGVWLVMLHVVLWDPRQTAVLMSCPLS